MSLTANRPATITATLKTGGAPYPIPLSADVSVRMYASDGATPITLSKLLSPNDIGANWLAGVVVASFTGAETSSVSPPFVVAIFTVSVDGSQRSWSVQVDVDVADESSALFPSRVAAVRKMRRDRLVLLANSIMPDLNLSDDFLWDKLLAAESQVGHMLRVPLTPTRFFSRAPSQQQIEELGGKPWAIDPPYDYNPADWYGDKWGLILTRHKPLQSVVGMKFVYPSPSQTIVDVPSDWIRIDAKYGQVQLVPTGTAYQTLLGGLFMSHLSGGKTLPFTISLEYVAGLSNVTRDYPDLIDAVFKLATVKIVEDAFLPQSGSISADGLSQSLSVDVSKYHDAVDRVINGEGSNGGLVARIHGIRMMVM